jgi:hypothetical protein
VRRTLKFYPYDSNNLWEITEVIQLFKGMYLISVSIFPSYPYDWTEYQDRLLQMQVVF